MTEDRERPGEDDAADELEKFFAPLDEDWPEDEPLLPEAPEGEVEAPEDESEAPAEGPASDEEDQEDVAEPVTASDLEEWSVEIEVPEEGELLTPEPGEETAEASAAAEAEEPAPEMAEDEADTGLFADVEQEMEPVASEEVESATVPPATEDGGEPELIDEEALGPPADEGAPEIPTVEEEPEPAAVEAAAEHFASGIREPEEVERELLADLQTPAPPIAPEHEPPSWQEAAEPLITEEVAPGAPAPGRDLRAALVSGALLGVAVIALLAIGKGPFTLLAMAVVLLGQAEFYTVLRARRLQPATLLGLVCGGLMMAGAYLRGPEAPMFALVLLMGLTVLWYMAAPHAARRNTTVNVAATILGGVYVPFLASFAILLLTLFPDSLGRNVFLVVIGMTVLYDVSAYAVGTLWGSRPMAPTISPQKSWEGAVGATVILLVVALSIIPAIEPFDATRGIGLALVLAVVAPLGDLVESALKRDLRVKDMGSLLPGHGGVLDRIDAILFTAPAAYYFLQLSF